MDAQVVAVVVWTDDQGLPSEQILGRNHVHCNKRRQRTAHDSGTRTTFTASTPGRRISAEMRADAPAARVARAAVAR